MGKPRLTSSGLVMEISDIIGVNLPNEARGAQRDYLLKIRNQVSEFDGVIVGGSVKRPSQKELNRKRGGTNKANIYLQKRYGLDIPVTSIFTKNFYKALMDWAYLKSVQVEQPEIAYVVEDIERGAEDILESYKFKRFSRINGSKELLLSYFEPFTEGDCGCEDTIDQFIQLEQRFEDYLGWCVSQKGDYPKILAPSASEKHMNFLLELNTKTKRDFYNDAPDMLKKSAGILFSMQNTDLNDRIEAEKFMYLTLMVLERGYERMSKIAMSERRKKQNSSK